MVQPAEFEAYRSGILRLRPDKRTNLVILSSVGSTNSLGRRIVQEFVDEGQGVPETTILAHEQSSGRGRLRRRWDSRRGRGVYVSVVRALRDATELATLPLLVPVAVARSVEGVGVAPCRLKWPNDVVVDGSKLGGILIDTVSRGDSPVAAVIGIGVNHGHHHRRELPREDATSIRMLRAAAPGLEDFTWRLLRALDEELAHAGDLAYAVRRYRDYSAHRDGDRMVCRAGDEVLHGVFRGFDGGGALRLEVNGTERLLRTAETVES